MVLSLGLRRVHRKVHGSGRPPSLLRSRALSHFRVTEHIPPTQHTRHWPRGTEVGYENALKLAVKQYVPLTNLDPQPGDVTFVAAHANGFPKVGIPYAQCISLDVSKPGHLGDVRAYVRRPVREVESPWPENPCRLDCGYRSSGPERYPQ